MFVGAERGIGFYVRMRSTDTHIVSVECGRERHSREKDPGGSVARGGSWEARSGGHSEAFEDEGVLLMPSVSSTGCVEEKFWVVQE